MYYYQLGFSLFFVHVFLFSCHDIIKHGTPRCQYYQQYQAVSRVLCPVWQVMMSSMLLDQHAKQQYPNMILLILHPYSPASNTQDSQWNWIGVLGISQNTHSQQNWIVVNSQQSIVNSQQSVELGCIYNNLSQLNLLSPWGIRQSIQVNTHS